MFIDVNEFSAATNLFTSLKTDCTLIIDDYDLSQWLTDFQVSFIFIMKFSHASTF